MTVFVVVAVAHRHHLSCLARWSSKRRTPVRLDLWVLGLSLMHSFGGGSVGLGGDLGTKVVSNRHTFSLETATSVGVPHRAVASLCTSFFEAARPRTV